MLERPSPYRWTILALITASGSFVATIPFSSMPVLFKEISDDINLNLVQIGTVWGISSLAGIFVSIIGGIISDKVSMKGFLVVSCILVGLTGALRGLADSFLTLAVFVFLNGVVRMAVPINLTKTVGIWFRGSNLGMAMGISAVGMGFGLMLGPLISATWLSPLLGGWRNVMYFYGAISVVMGVLWWVFGREYEGPSSTPERVPVRLALGKLMKLKALWLIGIVLAFRSASIMGLTGYLPLFLRDRGWTPANADGTLAAFYAISTLAVVPLASLSDRLGSRKAILVPGLITGVISIGLIPFVDGLSVWALMILAGIFMDGFMSLIVTMLLETEGVGSVYSGMAIGLVFTIAQIGSVVSPPVGNSLASLSSIAPFLFWAGLSAVGAVVMLFCSETGKKRLKVG